MVNEIATYIQLIMFAQVEIQGIICFRLSKFFSLKFKRKELTCYWGCYHCCSSSFVVEYGKEIMLVGLVGLGVADEANNTSEEFSSTGGTKKSMGIGSVGYLGIQTPRLLSAQHILCCVGTFGDEIVP